MNTTDWARAVRIALVVPGDSHIDDEFWRLSAPGVLPLLSRTTGADGEQMRLDAVRHTRRLAESSDLEVAADRLRAVNPRAAAYVDTSISFVRGPGGDTDISDRIARFLGCPTVATSTAVVRACRSLDVRRIAVLSVYVDELNATIPLFFEPQGIAIARIAKLEMSMEGGSTSEDMAGVDPGALVAAGRAVDGSDVDAVFIPCTAVRTLEAIEPLEDAIGKPVVTAVQATLWAVQRLAGVTADVPLGGRLFADA